MRAAIVILLAALLAGHAQARNPRGTVIPSLIGACTGPAGSSGGLVATVTQPRSTGSDHLLVFFNATGTTDSNTLGGANNPFQDVTYSWDFGDSGASGTGTWSYGANPGGNSMNTATGAIASHLYIVPDGQGDTQFTAKLTAKDGANTVVCAAPVITVYDGSGSNGFPTTATVCVFNTSVGSGCPSGASTLTASSFNTALSGSRSGKRVLFKCGDTFTGDNYSLAGVKARVGAYGGCQGTQTNRPIFSDPLTNDAIDIAGASGDVVISDIDFHGNGTANGAIGEPQGDFLKIGYQITLYNLNATGTSGAFSYAQGAQWGLIGTSMQNMIAHIGVFLNYSENNPPYSGNTINNLDYAAIMGNLLNGTGNTVTGNGQEVLRISACRLCAITNNTIENANAIGGVIKLHNGNSYHSFPTWGGAYTELIEISDNSFGGTSGGVPIDIDPQNNNDDERLRLIVFERNLITNAGCCQGGFQMSLAAVNSTVRDNAFLINSTASPLVYAQESFRFGQLGIEPVASNDEVYNNTFEAPVSRDNGQICIGMDGLGMSAPPVNSFVRNNLCHFPSGTHSVVLNTGTGNTVSNNTASPTASPAFTDASGTFGVISDFKPTANYTGGTTVPVVYDALGIAWSPTWDFGAVKH